MKDLTIVVPVRDKIRQEFIEYNSKYFKEYPLIVVNTQGGEVLKHFAYKYFDKLVDLFNARKIGYAHVETKYVLNLDSDVLIPEGYIEKAIEILEKEPKVGAVTLHFQKEHRHRGIAEFGISIWRKELLDKLYDVTPTLLKEINMCECLYMWSKLEKNGYFLEILEMKAIHLGDQL